MGQNDDGPTDERLMILLAQNDTEAMVELCRRYFARLVIFAERTGVGRDAEDIAQETLLDLWRRGPEFDPERSLRAFLFGIARHKTKTWHRREGRLPRVSTNADEGSEVPDRGPSPIERLSNEEQDEVEGARIIRLFDRLEPDRRLALLLDIYGLKDTEIGEILGCTTGAVAGRLNRAREQIKAYIGIAEHVTPVESDHGHQ